MIRFWLRELMGWFLILIGLYIFFLCLAMLSSPTAEFIFEAPVFTLIGIIVFRGGIHLLKVAVAARVCLETQAEVQKSAPVEKRVKKAEAPLDW